MEEKQMTRQELADKMGVSYSVMSNIFCGRRNLTFNDTCLIADILGVKVDEIVDFVALG